MKSVIVSGSTGNLGSAIVEKFLLEGYTVIGTVSKEQAPGKTSEQANLYYVPVDLRSEDQVQQFFKTTLNNYPDLSIAINTVGGFRSGNINETDVTALQDQYNLNFITSYNFARAYFMHAKRVGRLYLTGARTGMDMNNSKGMTAYGLSKSLVFRLSELLNKEGSKMDFHSTVIVPTTIDTPQNRAAMPAADFSKWTTPQSIAEQIFLHHSSASREELLVV